MTHTDKTILHLLQLWQLLSRRLSFLEFLFSQKGWIKNISNKLTEGKESMYWTQTFDISNYEYQKDTNLKGTKVRKTWITEKKVKFISWKTRIKISKYTHKKKKEKKKPTKQKTQQHYVLTHRGKQWSMTTQMACQLKENQPHMCTHVCTDTPPQKNCCQQYNQSTTNTKFRNILQCFLS